MRTHSLDIIPSIQRFSRKLDELTRLVRQEWVVVDELSDEKLALFFRSGAELLIAKAGRVERTSWEFLDANVLIMKVGGAEFLFRHGFLDEHVLALRFDGKDEYMLLVDAEKYESGTRTVERVEFYLRETYLRPVAPSVHGTLQTVFRETTEGTTLIIVSNGYDTVGASVFVDGKPAEDGVYVYQKPYRKLLVRDGRIAERFFLQAYKGYLFEKRFESEPTIGDRVTHLDGTEVEDLRLRFGLFRVYHIRDSVIVSDL